MTRPKRFILRMALFLVIIALLISPLAAGLYTAFQFNLGLNGLVVAIFLIGIAVNFRQVYQLQPEIVWLDDVKRHTVSSSEKLRLLTPLATVIGEGFDSVSLSATTTRSILDSVATRLDEQREFARYFVGLLIFLGLLGTFWGLSHAVGSMGEVIRSLTLSGGDASAAFEKLKSGMEAPLGGMGMAFSTSLFGLAGSLILGFLDVLAGHAQNTFFMELEEWLTSQTDHLADPAPRSNTQALPAYVLALLDRTAERLDEVALALRLAEEGRVQTHHLIENVGHRLNQLGDLVTADQALVEQLSASEIKIQPLLVRLVEETIKSREHVVSQLSSELRMVARAAAGGPGPTQPPNRSKDFLETGR